MFKSQSVKTPQQPVCHPQRTSRHVPADTSKHQYVYVLLAYLTWRQIAAKETEILTKSLHIHLRMTKEASMFYLACHSFPLFHEIYSGHIYIEKFKDQSSPNPSCISWSYVHISIVKQVCWPNRAVFVCYPQGWFSPGQVFVLDEYCARYGVRGCHRHLCYLSDLLERAENGAMIDPTLLHYSFAFCASHVHGNR